MAEQLPVLASTQFVLEQSQHVKVNTNAARKMLLLGVVNPAWYPDLHIADADWIFVLDALWPDFEPQHLAAALAWFGQQDRTLGG